jgi:hypothetical protein
MSRLSERREQDNLGTWTENQTDSLVPTACFVRPSIGRSCLPAQQHQYPVQRRSSAARHYFPACNLISLILNCFCPSSPVQSSNPSRNPVLSPALFVTPRRLLDSLHLVPPPLRCCSPIPLRSSLRSPTLRLPPPRFPSPFLSTAPADPPSSSCSRFSLPRPPCYSCPSLICKTLSPFCAKSPSSCLLLATPALSALFSHRRPCVSWCTVVVALPRSPSVYFSACDAFRHCEPSTPFLYGYLSRACLLEPVLFSIRPAWVSSGQAWGSFFSLLTRSTTRLPDHPHTHHFFHSPVCHQLD